MAEEVGGEKKLKEGSDVLNVKRKHWGGGTGVWVGKDIGSPSNSYPPQSTRNG